MAKNNQGQALINKWSTRAFISLVLLAIVYGIASLAIDSGSLFEYFLALIFLILAIKNTIYIVRRRST